MYEFTQYCVAFGQMAGSQHGGILIFHRGNQPLRQILTQPPADDAPEAPGRRRGARSHYIASLN